jgi:succinate dehydrogenase / fumarate reductase flavoprotein subunit
MAEGGIAASMGNVNSKDSWQVHFRDTMRGGKFLNHWRMAELHAKEAPDRVWELEAWGALFDRTADGRISQRNFGGHEYPRLAHVGDRTGLELIRTCSSGSSRSSRRTSATSATTRPGSRSSPSARSPSSSTTDDGDGSAPGSAGRGHRLRLRLLARVRPVRPLRGARGDHRHRRHRQVVQGDQQLLGVHRRRHALACGPAARWSTWSSSSSTRPAWSGRPSVKGILVTESVRGDGGVLTNSEGKRFMFDYVPDVFRKQYAETEEEGDRWYKDADNNRGRRSCSRATRLPARSTPRSRPAAGHRTAASSSTCRRGCRPRRSGAGCRRCTTSSRSWPTSTSRPSRWRSARPATT